MMSKININKINDINAVRSAKQAEIKSADGNKIDSANKKPEISADKLQFSDRAGEVGKLVDEIKSLPDVREAKVNALREQIAAGEYNPSSEEIADAFLKEEK